MNCLFCMKKEKKKKRQLGSYESKTINASFFYLGVMPKENHNE